MLPATMSPPALKGLAIATTLLLAGCRGRGSEPAGGSLQRDAAILTARTPGPAYLRGPQPAQAATAVSKIVALAPDPDPKSTRLHSSHSQTSYGVFCLQQK